MKYDDSIFWQPSQMITDLNDYIPFDDMVLRDTKSIENLELCYHIKGVFGYSCIADMIFTYSNN